MGTCTDRFQNGNETDVDCGGATSCPRCGTGLHCLVSGDCLGTCDAGVCSVPPLFGAQAPRALAVGTFPADLAVADLDGDGKLDIAITNRDSWDISLNWGNGDGTFTVTPAVQVSGVNGHQGGTGIAVGDFDGDGKLDLSIARTHYVGCCTGYTECCATVVRSAGSRTWLGAVDSLFTSHGCMNSAWAGRINADNKDDAVFGGILGAGGATDGPSWLWLGGATQLGPATRLGLVGGAQGGGVFVTGGDVNRDGNNDIVTRNTAASNVQVFLNDGTGQFPDAGVPFSVAAGSGDVIVAQVNADTNPDLIIGSDTAGRVGVAFGVGNGQFLAPASYPAAGAHGVAYGDVTGDGIPDLVVGGTGLSVLKGNGDGTFQPALQFLPTYKLFRTVLGDFNGDGKLDVAAITNLSNVQGATLFLNGQ
jgi:hypothetical protein